jgi:hypothetical protein
VAYIDTSVDVPEAEDRRRHAASSKKRGWCSSLWGMCCSVSALHTKAAEIYQKHQRYTHCEVYFPKAMFSDAELARIGGSPPDTIDENDLVVAFAAFDNLPARDILRAQGGDTRRPPQRHGVVGMLRAFTSPTYQTVSIRVSERDLLRAKDFAMAQLGKPYDFAGASWRLLIYPPAPTHDRWWCGSLTHGILKKAGLLRYQPLNTFTVGHIVAHITKSEWVDMNTVRPRQSRLVGDVVASALFGPRFAPGMPYPGAVQQLLDDARTAVDTSCNDTNTRYNLGMCRTMGDPTRRVPRPRPARRGGGSSCICM